MEDPIMMRLERQSLERQAAVRRLLVNQGRDDLVADYDRMVRDERRGVTGARDAWHSITPPQRAALRLLAAGYRLERRSGSSFYDATRQGQPVAKACRLPTARALLSRELAACDGGAFDPERVIVGTERGRFIVSVAGE
jgi:hypothetical protein